MTDGDSLTTFIARCREILDTKTEPAEIVRRIAPAMLAVAAGHKEFLRPEHRRCDPTHYARNCIYLSNDGSLSLFALVWLPGQWTPVHDHGSWGVVGVLEGILEERNYMSVDGEIKRDNGIRLRRGGMTLLPAGAVTTFVPNPDHIHVTGVAAERAPTLSLHLYGRNMNSFHIYDVENGTRRLIDVPHHQAH